MTFICQEQHIWKIHYKSWQKRWCSKCIFQQKIEERKKIDLENLCKEKELAEKQQRLFEEAKIQRENQNDVDIKKKVISTFKQIERDADLIATKMTDMFLIANGNNNESENLKDKYKIIYKIMVIPNEIFENYLIALGEEKMKEEFKIYAKSIHPDKNQHPEAKNAFQKVYQTYELILKKNRQKLF